MLIETSGVVSYQHHGKQSIVTYLPQLSFPRLRANDPSPSWRTVVVVAWTGLRGQERMKDDGADPPHPVNPYEPMAYYLLLISVAFP